MFPKEDGLEANFTLESEKGGVIDEPPFRILMLGNWSGDAEKKNFADRRPIEIDRDNFDEVMERLGTRLDLGPAGTLEFRSLDDLHPDEIYRRLPMFAELRDLRRRLKNDDTFYQAAREVRGTSGEGNTPASDAEPAAPADGLLDAILSQPAGGGKASHGATGDLAPLVSDLCRPYVVGGQET